MIIFRFLYTFCPLNLQFNLILILGNKKKTRGEKQPFHSHPSLSSFYLSLFNNLQVIYTLLRHASKNARLDLALNNMLINT